MQRHLYIIIAALLLLGCKVESTPFKETLPELKSGDMLFRLGRSRESIAVDVTDRHSNYSHAGIIAIRDGEMVVIHAVPDERPYGGIDSVRIDSISNFFSSGKSLQCLIARLPMDDSTALRVGSSALALYEKGTLFDSKFNTEDKERIYCTELLYHVYMESDIDICQGRRHNVPAFAYPLIMPSDILQNSDIEEIYYFDWDKSM